ncbi:hypothetical protein [Flavilitoribacter nigricans]|uniref:Cellulase Ig-like domain-containing protein n=1 Tax=Flavilitoribacter nigricans (strain ATCC 23147 / DSM 23189 / NBRC 102662 / NCIMB 1420 / SS-2) TaxID=1122177 RepID=A0A2D0NKA5_FLAN2|nr:hypothetical protein [Flavilitoribacter nigricans]PHN08173.1 hypothetical protein CRP01_02305 [Flavilitoribacter nigricans DSM 23189 = NBRC 102662]
MKILSTAIFFAISICCFSQLLSAQSVKSKPIVNQAGYNLGEAKRFVCYGAADGTAFEILPAAKTGGKPLFKGKITGYVGDFTAFNPENATEEFIVRVPGHGDSHPFWIADHLLEKLSSQLAYQFFIDVRGSEDPVYSNENQVAGGGPSRDGGAYTLEAVYEILLYASNPALFDRWHADFADDSAPDLIKLILWHAEFAFQHRDYNGPTAHRPYDIGHPGEQLQSYDYQNTLDQLAAVCAAYHSFLKPYLDEAKYQRYRQACLQKWEDYERDQVVRYWVKSQKWIDVGWQEFNEMGNVFGQAIFRNLFMYLAEREEADGQPEKFLAYAREAAADVIQNWDFNNPRHMWWIRNGEHITPQALAFFLMVAPESAPHGTRDKLAAWAEHMKQRTDNFWHYRKHNDTEWAHPKTKELGNTGLGGSMFVVADLLDDPELRALGWSQVNQVFGLNPAQAHYSNKSQERLDLDGYWTGIETGWPDAHPNGAGKLGRVRGALDGTPLDNMFPYNPEPDKEGVISYYATEGWAVTNRAWLSSVVFAPLGSQELRLLDAAGKPIAQVNSGQTVTIELKAALNQDWDNAEEGWVLLDQKDQETQKIRVRETGANTGLFRAEYRVTADAGTELTFSYGYLGFGKPLVLKVK